MRIKGKGKSILNRQRLPVLGLFEGLLDQVSGAAAAYSIRLLRADYSDGLLRVRAFDGSSDQGEADVLPDGNNEISLSSELTNRDSTAGSSGRDVSTLGELVDDGGANYDGFVSKWYDQSPNARHATNSTASEQPQIVDAGSLIKENGKPALNYNTNQDNRLLTSKGNPVISQPATFFGLGKLRYANTGNYFHDNNDNASTRVITYDRGGDIAAIFAGNNIVKGNATTSVERLRTSLFNGSSSKIKENGSLTGSGDAGSSNIAGITLGNANPAGSSGKAPLYLKELIFYPGDKIASGDDVIVEGNMNNFYNAF